MLTCVTKTEPAVCLTDHVDTIVQDAVGKLYRCAAEIQMWAGCLCKPTDVLQLGFNCQFNVVTPPGSQFGEV